MGISCRASVTMMSMPPVGSVVNPATHFMEAVSDFALKMERGQELMLAVKVNNEVVHLFTRSRN